MSFPLRFDVAPREPATTDEIDRRWKKFQSRSRAVSQPLAKRIAYQALRWSPALLERAKNLQAPKSSEASAAQVVSAYAGPFPTNFSEPSYPESVKVPSDVLTVLISNEVSITNVIDGLNATVAKTSATWLLIIDPSLDATQRNRVASILHSGAADDVDVVYGDECEEGSLRPVCKPPFIGPHTLLSYNVVGRPALLRIRALRDIGGFNLSAGRAFEHDAYLRLQEAGSRFSHVAKVLPGRIPAKMLTEKFSKDTVRVVNQALGRRGGGSVEQGEFPGQVVWRPQITGEPSVDILIPTRDRIDLVRKCIDAVTSLTTYPNYRITILDNDSVTNDAREYFAATPHRVISAPGVFNYAKIINHGVANCDAEFIVTLNNDAVLLTPDWLEQLVGLASLDDVGIVGVKLIDQNGEAEHEGFSVAPFPQHLRSGVNYLAHDTFISSIRDVSAVTGAVQIFRRDFYNELHGMDEDLRVTMNDVDLCLRSQVAGKFVVYTPEVVLTHAASSSRGSLDPIDDRRLFMKRWDILGSFRDPFFPESFELLGQTIFHQGN